MEKLNELYNKKDYLGLIEHLRQLAAQDRRIFSNGLVKRWCAERWRFFFLNEAVHDKVAMEAAEKKRLFKNDDRPPRQKAAERYLSGEGPAEWKNEMPPAQIGKIEKDTLVFVPGMLTGMLPVHAFQEAFPAVEKKYGWKILRTDVHPMRSCKSNAADITRAIEHGMGLAADLTPITEKTAKKPDDFFVITYSKGAPDFLSYLVDHPESRKRVKCIFNWAGAWGGSYLADNIYDSLKDFDDSAFQDRFNDIIRLISPVVNVGVYSRHDEFEIRECVRDLTTSVREKYHEEHIAEIDAMNIPIFNISGSTTVMDVPVFQIQGTMDLNKYDNNNDMQVTQKQAKVRCSMAADLAMLHGHHWDLSYSPFPKLMRMGSPNLDHPFPKEAAAVAMFQLAGELGLIS